jgi:hypothetical protein
MQKITLLVIFVSTILFDCCQNSDKEAEQLAKTHCGSCHQYPEPSLLDKTTWERSVLPQMAVMCGIPSEIAKITASQLIPDAAWLKIKAFYLTEAPKQLPVQDRSSEIGKLEGLFVPQLANISGKEIPNFTCVRIDTSNHLVHASDELNHQWWVLGPDAQTITKFDNQAAVTNIEFVQNPNTAFGTILLATYAGINVKVTNQKLGSAALVNLKNMEKPKALLSKLYRPTQVLLADLDHDKTEELVAAEYGYAEGTLAVYQATKTGTFAKKILNAGAGNIKNIVVDLDKDGQLDIVSLFAQGNERLMFYKNKGGLNFEEKLLLQFPPSYGSSYFELKDFNKDGYLDILYTCGDNADYSSILKPYHGVYLFENQGNNQFKQSKFFALNGAYKAIAEDFDQDGDLDIAAIGFFADFDQQADEGFVFLENQGGDLIPKGLNITALGRWIAIDAGDVDGDGDIDLVLGSHPASPSPGLLRESWYKGPGVVVLLNQKK